MKTIEVDPRVPGIRDEIPFPQAKQCSPGLDSSSSQSSVRLVRICSGLPRKPIVTVVENPGTLWIFQGRFQGLRAESSPPKRLVHLM